MSSEAVPLLERAQVRAIDQALIAAGVPGVLLMENAGRGAAERLATLVREQSLRRATLLVGPGNNGGDALVIARHLALLTPSLELTVVCSVDPGELKGDAGVMRDAWRAVGGAIARCVSEPEATGFLEGRDLVVDGLFGTGLTRPLTGVARALVEATRACAPRCAVALDLPSGLDADTGAALGDESGVFRADRTYTFAASKPGLHTGAGLRLSGRVEVVPLGAPIPLKLLDSRTHLLTRGQLAPRRLDAHKGDGGHVLVVGGSAGHTGAALLAARGAHRAGAGLVTVASRASASLDTRVLETMTAPLPDDEEGARRALAALLPRASAVVVGPGLGTDPWARVVVDAVMALARVPVVVDADALGFVRARGAGEASARPSVCVLTPHPLEAARLLGVQGGARVVNEDRLSHARSAAERFDAVAVLKGAGTVIATADGRAWISPVAEPALAVAGSGDVLSGVLAARLGERGESHLDAVQRAVVAHGRAGELVRAARGASRGALAGELADAVSLALEGDGA